MSNNDNNNEEKYPKYRIIHGENEYDYRYLIVPNPRWDEIQPIVEAGYNKASDIVINETLENMLNVGYEQLLQNRCKEKSIDPCLVMAIVAIISAGDPGADNGLFGLGGGSVTTQIEEGVEKLLELEKKYRKGTNLLGWIQSFKKWTDVMNVANKEKAAFDKDWVGAMKYCGFTADEMCFYPAVMHAYSEIPKRKTANSQVTSGSVRGAEFPFITTQLSNVYYTKSYGATNYGAGVTTLVDGIVLQLGGGEEDVHSPVKGTANLVDGDIRIVNPSTGVQYIFSGLTNAKAGEMEIGSVMGTCTAKLIVRCLDSNGRSLDPKSQWEILGGKLSQDASKSLGKYIEEEMVKGF